VSRLDSTHIAEGTTNERTDRWSKKRHAVEHSELSGLSSAGSPKDDTARRVRVRSPMTHLLAPLVHLEHIRQTAGAHRDDRRAPKRLETSHDDEHGHGRRSRGDQRADDVERVGREVDDLAAYDLGDGGPQDGDPALEAVRVSEVG
jgi:hypothetical protein